MTQDHTRWYPDRIFAGEFGGRYDDITIEFLFSDKISFHHIDKASINIAEFGIWKGATSLQFARFLNHQGSLYLFDYEDKVAMVKQSLNQVGFTNILGHGSSYKYLDSYNWSLMKILETTTQPIFDYVYIDGSHTWAIDALTFFLCDRLLKPGGYIDFDDYHWKIRGSSLDPLKVPLSSQLFTEEQMNSQQVKLIIDLLVKREPGYREVFKNKIFQKMQ